jgi:transposase
MSEKRTYSGFTTAQQRKLLFEVWEKTKDIEKACQQACVSQRMFYYWKPRFEQSGYVGLEKFASRVAHKLNYKDKVIENQVIEMKRDNPDWGKARISQEMAKGNNWVGIVSPNTVRRMLETAGMWRGKIANGEKSFRKHSPNG